MTIKQISIMGSDPSFGFAIGWREIELAVKALERAGVEKENMHFSTEKRIDLSGCPYVLYVEGRQTQPEFDPLEETRKFKEENKMEDRSWDVV